ncbi:MAG TPA: alcohol dehydrogenase catalytic domain-containing protein [Terriglobales bacterium]|nr:alcohol dehydrogenase catalytic domain-containing protein [Terriglobales bacterium]
MKAVCFAATLPRYLLTKAAGGLAWSLLLGPHACTRLADLPEPALPDGSWVRIRTRLGGICGSDLATVTLRASPATSPFASFPFVPGHESVGEIAELGADVRGFSRGERVTVNPLLACAARRVDPPCPECAAGRPQRCQRFTDGALPPGMLTGTTRSLGGSWGESFVAHESQLVRVPAALSDEEAVLIEPLACSVHAVRGAPPRSGERVLVVGAGSIGLLTLAALRELSPESEITIVARHAFQGEHAARLGAAWVVRGANDQALAEAAGARLLGTLIGPPVAVGGFDRAFVCVGGRRGTETALRFTRAGGTVALLGNVAALGGLDWTPLWLKELTLRGSVCYGGNGAPARLARGSGAAGAGDFGQAVAIALARRDALRPLVTHAFPIREYRRAIGTALDRRGSKSVKVVFRF